MVSAQIAPINLTYAQCAARQLSHSAVRTLQFRPVEVSKQPRRMQCLVLLRWNQQMKAINIQKQKSLKTLLHTMVIVRESHDLLTVININNSHITMQSMQVTQRIIHTVLTLF